MSDGSDLELKSNLVKKNNAKQLSSPSDGLLKIQKKLTTKEMVEEALKSLKTRKGVSLYAIKKYMSLTYDFDSDKMAYLIKKQLKTGVEEGTILQVKGIGVTGSFKLVVKKNNPEKKKQNDKKKVTKKTVKIIQDGDTKQDGENPNTKTTKNKTKTINNEKESQTSKEKAVKVIQKKVTKSKTKEVANENEDSTKMVKKDKIKGVTKTKNKMASVKTPSKKKVGLMKRKSIGSIIRTPKMRPKA